MTHVLGSCDFEMNAEAVVFPINTVRFSDIHRRIVVAVGGASMGYIESIKGASMGYIESIKGASMGYIESIKGASMGYIDSIKGA